MDLQKQIICAEAHSLPKEDRIRILSIIKRYDPDIIKRFPDGCRIDLSLLPESVIQNIHDKIKYILNLE